MGYIDMAKTKRKLSNKEQFQREQLRIEKAVSKLREQGYEVDTSIIPKQPKRVTQQKLKEIKAIKPKQLKKLAYTYNLEGEKIGYEQYQQWLEEQPQNQVYYPTISIIENVLEGLQRLSPPPYPVESRKNELISIFQDTITYYEEDLQSLEEYLIEKQDNIMSLIDEIQYGSGGDRYGTGLERSFVQLAYILNVTALTPSQAERLSNMSESRAQYEEY